MKNNLWKKTAAIFALSFGALIAPPAYAECVLCKPAESGNLSKVEMLLANRDETPVDINATDENGRTALLLAVKENRTEIAELLINDPHDPADVNISSNSGRTPLMWAAQNGNQTLVELLQEKGGSISAIGGGQNKSVLEYAMDGGFDSIAEYLVQNGADCPNETVRIGDSCINPPECGDNMQRGDDGIACICLDSHVPDNFGGCVLDCPDYQHPVNNACQCIDGYEMVNGHECVPNCAADEERIFGECVPKCDPNTEVRDGFSCVCVDGYERNSAGICELQCGENEVLNGDSCVCVDGFVSINGGVCEIIPICVEGENYNDAINMCDCDTDNGYERNSAGVCELQCGANEEWQGNSCVCEPGFERDNNGDCRIIPMCGDNEVRNGFSCDCVDGYTRINGVCELQCGDNEELQGNSCVCVDRFVRKNGVCILEPIIAYCENAGKFWMPVSRWCVSIPPVSESYYRNASFIKEYGDNGGNLHAVDSGHYGRNLLLASAHPNARDSRNKIVYLLQNNANPASKADLGYTALHYIVFGWTTAAKANERRAALLALLNGGAASIVNARTDSDATTSGQPQELESALHFAAAGHYGTRHDRWGAYSVLLDHGANPSLIDGVGFTPFAEALLYDIPLNLVQKSINKGLNLNGQASPNATPIGYAVFQNHADAVGALADAGADCNRRQGNGRSAYNMARYYERWHILNNVLKVKCHHAEVQHAKADCQIAPASSSLNIDTGEVTEIPAQYDEECIAANEAEYNLPVEPEPYFLPE